jgi:hypothetical protein
MLGMRPGFHRKLTLCSLLCLTLLLFFFGFIFCGHGPEKLFLYKITNVYQLGIHYFFWGESDIQHLRGDEIGLWACCSTSVEYRTGFAVLPRQIARV